MFQNFEMGENNMCKSRKIVICATLFTFLCLIVFTGCSNANAIKSYLKYGDSLVKLEKYDEALKAYDKAISLNPKCSEAYLGKGQTYYEKVLAYYSKAMENNSTQKIPIPEDTNNSEQAYDKAIELDSKYAEAYYGKGQLYTQEGENDKAIQSYDKAIQLKPNYAEAYFGKGHIFNYNGETDQAIQAYDKAIELKPDYAEAYYEKGSLLEGTGSNMLANNSTLQGIDTLKQAITALDNAIRIKPDYADAYFIKGVSLRELNKYDDAILALDKSIELDSKNTNAYFNKVWSLEKLSKLNEAIQTLDEAFKTAPNYNYAELYYEKAKNYAVLNDTINALDNLKKSVDLDFHYKTSAEGDQEFNSIRNLDEFKAIVNN